MALKVHRVVVVGCPRCVLTNGDESEGVGKSCLCNRFVRPDSFTREHSSRLFPQEWTENPVYNGDHFLYWGAATRRLPDGTRARFQVVEQTEFSNCIDSMSPFPADFSYSKRATATLLTSRGKIAYRLHSEEEYAIPSSVKNTVPARATQIFPNYEFGEGKGVTAFMCVFDPSLKGEDISRQVDFLTRFLRELVKTKRKVVVVCTKCDQVDRGKIQLGANLAATVCKKPIPFIQTSAVENVNVLEAFHLAVGSNRAKRSSFYSKNGRNFPGNLVCSYHDVIQLRGKDRDFAIAEFTKAIGSKVNSFNNEWSILLPMLRCDQAMQNSLKIIGEEEAKKIYCQRIMQLKVDELRQSYGRRQRMSQEQSRNYQSELLEAITNHPDLGNDAFYQCLYTPSIQSDVSTVHSPSSDELDITSPLSFTSLSTHTPNRFPLPEAVSVEVRNSLGSPVPKSSVPPLPDSKASSVSPHGNTPSKRYPLMPFGVMKKLNRSTEVLATLPRVKPGGVYRHSSFRFQHRTLPPLPTCPLMSPTEMKVCDDLALCQPHLEDSDSVDNGSSLERHIKQKRRLSSSMDCLSGSDILSPPLGEPSLLHPLASPQRSNLDVEPYLHPVEIKQIMDSPVRVSLPVMGSASMRVGKPKNRPSLPRDMSSMSASSQSINRPKTLKEKDGMRLLLHEQLSYQEFPSSAGKSRPNSSPPPPLPPVTHDPSIVGSPPGESSLDFPNPSVRILSYPEKTPLTILHSDHSDSTSVKSSPFASVDDEKIPTLASDEEDCLDATSLPTEVTPKHVLPRRRRRREVHGSVDSSGSTVTFPEDFGYRNDPSAINLYASIPENDNDEYLTMTAAVSSSGSHVQGIIKKLQYVTQDSSRHLVTSKPRHISVDDIHPTPPSGIALKRSSTGTVARPLPPSPVKPRKSIGHTRIPSRRRNSGSGKGGADSNIYESIDEEWIVKLRREGSMKSELTSANDLAPVMEMFWNIPEVKQHWLRCIRTAFPGFQPPKTDTALSPFHLNPVYLATSTLLSSGSDLSTVKEPSREEDSSKESSPVDESPSVLSEKPVGEKTQKGLCVTDSFVERINRQLQREEDSSSSDDEEEESDMESSGSESTIEDSTAGDTLERTGASDLLIIREQFGGPFHQRNTSGVIDLDPSSSSEDSESEMEEDGSLVGDTDFQLLDKSIPTALQAFLTNGSFPTSEPKGHLSSSLVEEKDGMMSLEVPTSQHINTKNGHLSVRALNSMDSGISANDHNGLDDS